MARNWRKLPRIANMEPCVNQRRPSTIEKSLIFRILNGSYLDRSFSIIFDHVFAIRLVSRSLNRLRRVFHANLLNLGNLQSFMENISQCWAPSNIQSVSSSAKLSNIFEIWVMSCSCITSSLQHKTPEKCIISN